MAIQCGKRIWPWRAVNSEDEVLDRPRRDKAAA
jgi:transposase-like protein